MYGNSSGATGAQAARFVGDVYIAGNLTVAGAYPKSAAVMHPDGTLRRLYCVESPESWFEDFGKGQLVGGRATVTIDAEFAALVQTADYYVFPVAEGDTQGLYVTGKTPTGFEVREVRGGTGTAAFSYRIVAKRKDIAGPRLEKVAAPAPVTLPPVGAALKAPAAPAPLTPPPPPTRPVGSSADATALPPAPPPASPPRR